MSEYTKIERPFLQQLAELGWTVTNQDVTETDMLLEPGVAEAVTR